MNEQNKIEFDWELYQTGDYDCLTKSGDAICGLTKYIGNSRCEYPLIGWREDEYRGACAEFWNLKGKFYNSYCFGSADLMLVRKKKTYNVIVYASGDKIILSTPRPIFVKSELFEYYESVDEEEKRLRLTYKNLRYLKIIEIEI